MNLGVLGAGGIVPCHLEAAKRLGIGLARIADLRLDAARDLADRFGIGAVSDDPADVVGDPQVQVVLCALPTFLHSHWLRRSAAAGKHILTEKPLCRTTGEARQLLRICARNGVKLCVGYQRRFSPARVAARGLIQSAALGTPITWVLSSSGPRCDFYRGPGNWMWDAAKGGGLIMDGSIHDFDFACWVLGRPARMFAQSRRISDTVSAPTQASATVIFESGDVLTYSVAWQEGDCGSASEAPRVVGTKGTLVLDSDFSYTHYNPAGSKMKFSCGPSDLFGDQLLSFASYLEGDRCDYRLTTGEDALYSLWVAEKIVEAGAQGRTFRSPWC